MVSAADIAAGRTLTSAPSDSLPVTLAVALLAFVVLQKTLHLPVVRREVHAVEQLQTGREATSVDRMCVQDEQLQLRSTLSDFRFRA